MQNYQFKRTILSADNPEPKTPKLQSHFSNLWDSTSAQPEQLLSQRTHSNQTPRLVPDVDNDTAQVNDEKYQQSTTESPNL